MTKWTQCDCGILDNYANAHDRWCDDDSDCKTLRLEMSKQNRTIWKKSLRYIYGLFSGHNEIKKIIRKTTKSTGRFFGVGVYWGGCNENHETLRFNQRQK